MVLIIMVKIMIIVKNIEYGEGDNSFLVVVVVAMNTISDSHSNLGVDTSIPIVVVATESLLMFGG